MKRIIFKKITIIDQANKLAKVQNFIDGINVITSDENGGNWVGKSSILRSLFHSLGADSHFNRKKWDIDNNFIYLLDFSFDNEIYKIVRFSNFFKLFKNNELIFKTENREIMGNDFSSLIDSKLLLKNANTLLYSQCAPVYYFLINFYDQLETKLCKFTQFKSLSNYLDIYDDVIYYNLGLDNLEYSVLKEKISKLQVEQREIKEINNNLKVLIDKIQNDYNTFSLTSAEELDNEFNVIKEDYENKMKEYNTIKLKLLNAKNQQVSLNQLLKEIDAELKCKEKETNKIVGHNCPYCNAELSINKSLELYFSEAVDSSDYLLTRISIEAKLTELERKISDYQSKHDSLYKIIKSMENKVSTEDKEIKAKIQSLGYSDILNKLNSEISKNNERLLDIRPLIRTFHQEKNKLEKYKNEVDGAFSEIIKTNCVKYNIGGLDLSKVSSASSVFGADGTQVNVAIILWLTSLLKTKKQVNNNGIFYPIVIDTPNNADFSNDNKEKIFEMIFDLNDDDTQIITSCVGFESQNNNINIIKLTNKQFSLLNEEDYKNEFNKVIKFIIDN